MKKKTSNGELYDVVLNALAEFYQGVIKVEMASKKDLERFATKKDLERFASKKDLERFATKKDLERFATKEELNEGIRGLESELANMEKRLSSQIDGNNHLITNVEIDLIGRIKKHDKRIKVLEQALL